MAHPADTIWVMCKCSNAPICTRSCSRKEPHAVPVEVGQDYAVYECKRAGHAVILRRHK